MPALGGPGAKDRRERDLSLLDAGRHRHPLRARLVPERADRARPGHRRREPRHSDRGAVRRSATSFRSCRTTAGGCSTRTVTRSRSSRRRAASRKVSCRANIRPGARARRASSSPTIFRERAARSGRRRSRASGESSSGPPRPLTFGRGPDIGAAASRDGTAIAFPRGGRIAEPRGDSLRRRGRTRHRPAARADRRQQCHRFLGPSARTERPWSSPQSRGGRLAHLARRPHRRRRSS